jgi:DNA-binding IclR family transcriptional regulator
VTQQRHRRERESYAIKSVVTAFDVLESLVQGEGERGVTEMALELGQHKNTIFRTLATLEHLGYVEQSRRKGSYRLGVKVLQMGQAYTPHRGLLKVARPVLERLAAAHGETAHLSVLRSNKVVFVDAVESTASVRAISRVGAELPLSDCVCGKLFVAFAGDHLPEMLAELAAVREEEVGDVDLRKLSQEVGNIRQRGYALDKGETETNVWCVAVPIYDRTGHVLANLSLCGPACRIDDERVAEELAPALLQAAKEISQQLGGKTVRTAA